MLDRLAPGDVVTVTRIDRLARSTFDLFAIVKRIVDAKAQFRSLAEPWADTGTSSGRLMLAVLGGLADVERDLIRTRTAEGRSRAKAQGISRLRGYKLDLTPISGTLVLRLPLVFHKTDYPPFCCKSNIEMTPPLQSRGDTRPGSGVPGGCAVAVVSTSKQEFARLEVLLRVQWGRLRTTDQRLASGRAPLSSGLDHAGVVEHLARAVERRSARCRRGARRRELRCNKSGSARSH
jgi:hypothetical protein